jgi:hypothetical protein
MAIGEGRLSEGKKGRFDDCIKNKGLGCIVLLSYVP